MPGYTSLDANGATIHVDDVLAIAVKVTGIDASGNVTYEVVRHPSTTGTLAGTDTVIAGPELGLPV